MSSELVRWSTRHRAIRTVGLNLTQKGIMSLLNWLFRLVGRLTHPLYVRLGLRRLSDVPLGGVVEEHLDHSTYLYNFC